MNTIGSFSIGLVAAIGFLPATARAQAPLSAQESAAPAARPETLKGLIPARSGRVAGVVIVGDRTAISAGAIPADSRELPVTAVVAKAVSLAPVGRVNADLLDREITAKFNSVDHCRIDVARRKRLAPAQIAVDSLTVRWTIAGKGEVAAMEVIGSTPVDPDVLDCIKRDANSWRFTAPLGGEVRLNRALVFRRLPPAHPRP